MGGRGLRAALRWTLSILVVVVMNTTMLAAIEPVRAAEAPLPTLTSGTTFSSSTPTTSSSPPPPPPPPPSTSEPPIGELPREHLDPRDLPSPTDLDDNPTHRARFVLDRNWALTGSVLRAGSSSYPSIGITSLLWAYDQTDLGAVAETSAVKRIGPGTGSEIAFQVKAAGLHHLTLTVTWSDGVKDRVTTPIYVENPAIHLLSAYENVASVDPEGELPSLGGLVPMPREVDDALTLAFANLPVVMVISDFLRPGQIPNIALPVANVPLAMADIAGLPGVDMEAGFGTIAYDGTTGLGTPVTHLGQTLVTTILGAGLANVVFVNGIDVATGNLNRAAIRNAVVWAVERGQVDAILWGLPSAAYLPAVHANALRPHVNLDQTPLLSLAPTAALPAASGDWRQAPIMLPESESILEFLWTEAFLKAEIHPETDASELGEVLYAHRDEFSPHTHALIEAFRNDQRFDSFLQDQVLRLNEQGVPFIAPSENCPEFFPTQFMTMLGVNQLVGVVTVAHGTATKVDDYACKGPDRTAAAHGTGVDFYTNPDPLSYQSGVVSDPPSLNYLPNSLGAAAKVAAAAARYRFFTTTLGTPWKANDLVGMLTVHAQERTSSSTFAEGNGYLNADTLGVVLPDVFPRTSEVIFSPYNPFEAKGTAVFQYVVRGAQRVSEHETAAADDYGVTGGPRFRFFTKVNSATRMQDMDTQNQSRFRTSVVDVDFEKVSPELGVQTVVMEVTPTNLGTQVTPPREWLLPGLYSGRTWISTPSNGIIQLPINIGIGSIVDVYRFLAPNTPVSDTAVCLALPLKLIGDLTGLRKTAHELEEHNICIYWTNTDEGGVARFYSPLPLAYDLISFFSGPFAERVATVPLTNGEFAGGGGRSSGPPYYPHLHESIVVKSPVNIEGITGFVGSIPGSPTGWFEARTGLADGKYPAYVDADLPYPLGFFHQNQSFAVAISINWRYRDNIEATHILPIPSILSPEFLGTLEALPSPVRDILVSAAGGTDLSGGLIETAPEHLNPVLGTVQDAIKGALPVDSTYVDALLGQPLTKALPLNLQSDPSACQWGYGHESSPLMMGVTDKLYDPAHRTQADLDAVFEQLNENEGEEAYPDTLVMRVQPTLNYLLGLGTQIPLCSAVYPFNIPQPNYESDIQTEFDVHLESSILIVCLEVKEIECFILVPNPVGDGHFIVDAGQVMEDLPGAVMREAENRSALLAAALADPLGTASGIVGETKGTVSGIANTSLPEKIGLTTDGHVILDFDQPTYDQDHGFLIFIALPLDLSAAGFLDPLIGVLERSGVSADAIPQINLTLPENPLVNESALADVDDLLRDSIEDLLRMQAYVEVKRPVFHFDTWWWDDSFFDARISVTPALPRSDGSTAETPEGAFNLAEDWWWLTQPNLNRAYFERGLRFWDPITLKPDIARLQAAKYPWKQPEFFEVVMEVWDDEEVVDVQMNQIHTHDASNAHDFVNSALHCTNEDRADTDPVTGQACLEGLLAYEEGDRWFMHQDPWGTGVYDPNLGLVSVMLEDLGVIDSILGTFDDKWQMVWSNQVSWPLLTGPPTPLNVIIEEQLEIDPKELHWWKRDSGPTANRRVYSDLYTNSSFLLWEHHKTCEEIHDLPGQVALFMDQHPRWKGTCPWQGGVVKEPDLDGSEPKLYGLTKNGWAPATVLPPGPSIPATGGALWWTHRGVQCEATRWERFEATADAAERVAAIEAFYAARGVAVEAFAYQDGYPFEVVCGNFDGWQYWVLAQAGFDGPQQPKWNRYSHLLQPRYYPGTFRMDLAKWNECKATPSDTLNGWPCTGDNPMEAVWEDVASRLSESSVALRDYHTNRNFTLSAKWVETALLFFGLNYDNKVLYKVNGGSGEYPYFANNRFGSEAYGGDKDELYATVPLAAEWPGFYESVTFREIDANFSQARPQPLTNHSHIQRTMAKYAPLIRDWLEGDVAGVTAWLSAEGVSSAPFAGRASDNPFWADVSGEPIVYQDLARPRSVPDADEPRRLRPDGSFAGSFACDGSFWAGECHDRQVNYDVGDLSGFGRGGYWGRTIKPKLTFIPQGSTFARWNVDHLVEKNGTLVSTRDYAAGIDRDVCWFDPIRDHSRLPHEETRNTFDTVFYSNPYHFGFYSHQEPESGYGEPVPSLPYGNWCTNDLGARIPARSEREYIPLRLPVGMRGGDPDETLFAGVTPHVFEGPFDANLLAAKLTTNVAPKLVMAVLTDVLGLGDHILGDPLGGIGTGLNTVSEITGVPLVTLSAADGSGAFLGGGAIGNLVDLAGDLIDPDLPAPVLFGGSPVVPLVSVEIDEEVDVAELVLVHSFDFFGGAASPTSRGVLMARTAGENWTLLPSRGSPGFTHRSGGVHLAFADLSRFRGETVMLGAQVLGSGWESAVWDILSLTVLPSGVNGVAGPRYAGWDLPLAGPWTTMSNPSVEALNALQDGANVRLVGPLTVPEGKRVELTGTTIVVDCAPGACPITVVGELVLEDVLITPRSSSASGSTGVGEGAPIEVLGSLVGDGLELRGLLGGLKVLGGSVELSDCWLIDTGHVGVMSFFGSIRLDRCVLSDQVVGVYALGGQVHLEGNLFYRMVRSAGTFDEAWGTVRDNWVIHTKQAAFYQRGPLGASNLAVFGNRIEETGMGIGSALALEDRVLSLNPLELSVPISARTRIQENRFEWNNLEAIEAGPLSAPVVYGNDVTHSNIGVRVGWLDNATIRYNDLYSDTFAYVEPADRTDPANDGNTWSGLWQLAGLTLPSDATRNYWGPGAKEFGAIWPVDMVLHDGRVSHADPASAPAAAPMRVALTAPGYGGGALPVLGKIVDGVVTPILGDDPLSVLSRTIEELPENVVDPDLIGLLPLDDALITGWKDRKVTVAWDVGPGVEAFRVEGTYYKMLGMPDLAEITSVDGLLEALNELPILDPTRVLTPQVSRVEAFDVVVPSGGRSGEFQFAFDGISESRVLWRVVEYKRVGSAEWVGADGVDSKDAVVHNSLIWPLLPELAFLLNEVAVTTIDEALGLVEESLPVALVPADAGPMQGQQLPMRLMADGTLPVGGQPSLLGIARDQDPVMAYEYRYSLSTEPGVTHELGVGLARERTHPLPDLEEGVTMTVQGRALDASGLVSPFVGAKVLLDTQPPRIDLEVPGITVPGLPLDELCLDPASTGVEYWADETVDPSWGEGRRASGIGRLSLRAATLDGSRVFTWSEPKPTLNHYHGTFMLPEAGRLDGLVYVVTGAVQDRAGHAASDVTAKLRLDLSVPTVEGVPVLALVPVDETLKIVYAAVDLGCGIKEILLIPEVDGVEWPPVTVAGNPGLISLPAAPYQDREVRFRVVPVDNSGKEGAGSWTNEVKVDFDSPVTDLVGLIEEIGRTILDGLDLGASAGGGTVLSSPPPVIPIQVVATHPNPSVSLEVKVFVDDVDRSGLVEDGVYSFPASTMSRDAPHVVRVVATGSNGLSSSDRLVFYFPSEPSAVPLENNAASWSLVPGRANSPATHEAKIYPSGGNNLVYAESRDGVASTATFNTEVPSARVTVGAKVYYGSRVWCSGRTDLLRVMDDQQVRVGLFVDGCSNSVKLERQGQPTLTLPISITTAWHDVRLVIGPSSVDLFYDGAYIETYALGAASRGVTGVGTRAINGETYLDEVTLLTRSLGFYGFNGWLPIDSLSLPGWTRTGLGSYSAQQDANGIVLKASGGSSDFRLRSPAFKAAQFSHASGYVRLDSLGTTDTTVFGVLGTDDASVLMRALVEPDGDVRFSDGAGMGPVAARWVVGEWHRLDVELAGASYVVTVDNDPLQRFGFATGSALRPKSIFLGHGNTAVSVDRLRFESGSGVDHTFTAAVESVKGWTRFQSPGTSVDSDVGAAGLVGKGLLRILGSASKDKYATASVTLPVVGQRYAVDVAFRTQASSLPDHQAVLAGYTSAGALKWAITAAPVGLSAVNTGNVMLYLTDSAGQTTPLATTSYASGAWHAVRASVDTAGTLTVYVNEQLLVTKTGLASSLGGVAKLGMGDIWPGDLLVKTGSGVLELDDVSVARM